MGCPPPACGDGGDDNPHRITQQREPIMKMLPLQLVIIDLENGQRGVFIGRPLITEDTDEKEHQVQSVWFTDIQDMPDSATLEQLTRMALEQMSQGRTLQ
jgi:hypothetical protein